MTTKVLHIFHATPIPAKYFLNAGRQKTFGVAKTKLFDDLYKTSWFYAIQLHHCVSALKMGRAVETSGGIATRLKEYLTKYGNFKILYLKRYAYANNKRRIDDQPVSRFENSIISKLPRPLRGK